MFRWTLIASLALVVLSGCGASLDERRNSAISNFQTSHLDTAKAQFTTIIDQHPADGVSYYYLGRIYHAEGKYEMAAYNYQRALLCDPSNSQARLWLERAENESPIAKNIRIIPNDGQLPQSH